MCLFKNRKKRMKNYRPEIDFENKCYKILEWAKRNPHFRTQFIKSVLDFYYETGIYTSSQEQAINNIIIKWKIKL